MFFDGLKQTCVRFKVVQAKSAAGRRAALRCADYAKASKVGKHPKCPGSGLKGGGRSQWAIRPGGRCKRVSRKK